MKSQFIQNTNRILTSLPCLVFFLIPLFKPSIIVYRRPTVSLFLDVWAVAVAAVIAVMYLGRMKVSRIILAIGAFEGFTLISTFINHGDYITFAKQSVKLAALCVLIDLCRQVDTKPVITALMIILQILCILNTLSIISSPQGMYILDDTTVNWSSEHSWILGYDNVHITFILPAVRIFLIYALNTHIPFSITATLVAFTLVPVYVTWSATSVSGITVFIAVAVITLIIKESRVLLNYVTFAAANIVAFFVIVIFRLQEYFSFIIVDILKKDLTFTHRTDLWDAGLAAFRQKPLTGYGVVTGEISNELIGQIHCHNYYLQILFESGITGMVLFIIILLLLVRPMLRCGNTVSACIMGRAMLTFLLISQFDIYSHMMFFAMIVMAYHIEKIAGDLGEKVPAPPLLSFVKKKNS